MRLQLRKVLRTELALTGEQLIAAYQSAITNRSTAQTAQHQARLSEQHAVSYISEAPASSNSVFVTPNDIPRNMQDTLAKASLDAHMKKVQADQITDKTERELQTLERDCKQKYINKKVQVSILEAHQNPVESYWQNSKTGKVTTGQIKNKRIKGTIEDIVLSKNLLILAPTKVSKIFNPERKLIAVYIINPTTLSPMVAIKLI
ncbi:MAG: hypothetical protein QG628_80 [Patescibacteria group bacterium]|jgi:hypothetical protein|nr:hypothetical protein [Patescibacteria group bacterium]